MPVLAWPMMSWPCSATGRVSAWIGNGWVMPTASRASTVAGSTPSSAKDGVFRTEPFSRGVPRACSRGRTPSGGRRAARRRDSSVGADRFVGRPGIRSTAPAYPSVRCATVDAPEQTAAGSSAAIRSTDEDYRLAVVDLLGALAYGELTAFERLADDAVVRADHRRQGRAGARWPSPSTTTSRCCATGWPSSAPSPEEAMEPFIAGAGGLPRAHRAGGLAGGPGQGLRRRRHRRGLLPRGVGLPRRLDPRPGARASSRTPGTRSSPSTGSAPRSRPTPGSPAGWRCGAAGWWARRSARPSGSPPSGTRWRRCWWAGCRTGAPTWPRSAGCSPGSPRTTPRRMATLGLSA